MFCFAILNFRKLVAEIMKNRMAEQVKPPLTGERRERITAIVAREGAVRVGDLSRLFGVSEVTIRNDLESLARQGVLVREHGGAIANSGSTLSLAFGQRAQHNEEIKRRIGYAAAQLVQPGDTIIMDAGTTLMEMAKNLSNHSPLTVVTNALNVATQVGSLPDVNVILAGGALSRETISTIGALAERDLNDLIVDKLFLGAHVVDMKAGVSDVSVEVARVKMAMIRAARQVILLADSSKWGRKAFARVVPLSRVHTVITDAGLAAATIKQLKKLEISVIVT